MHNLGKLTKRILAGGLSLLLVLTGIPTVSYSVENSADIEDIEAAIDYDGGGKYH